MEWSFCPHSFCALFLFLFKYISRRGRKGIQRKGRRDSCNPEGVQYYSPVRQRGVNGFQEYAPHILVFSSQERAG
jgi:hypothetical protein